MLQPSTLLQRVVELHPAMGAHVVRPVQPPLLLLDVLPLPELLLPVEPPLPELLLLPPPSWLPSSRALPPHAKAIDAATPSARSQTDADAP